MYTCNVVNSVVGETMIQRKDCCSYRFYMGGRKYMHIHRCYTLRSNLLKFSMN